jgi:hypothetical protein
LGVPADPAGLGQAHPFEGRDFTHGFELAPEVLLMVSYASGSVKHVNGFAAIQWPTASHTNSRLALTSRTWSNVPAQVPGGLCSQMRLAATHAASRAGVDMITRWQ